MATSVKGARLSNNRIPHEGHTPSTADEHLPSTLNDQLPQFSKGPASNLVGAGDPNPAPEHFCPKRRWGSEQLRTAKRITVLASLQQSLRLGPHELPVAPGVVGEVGKVFHELGILLFQEGQQLLADPHPFKTPVLIRGILEPSNALLPEPLAELLPAAIDERPDHSVVAAWFDGRKAGNARPSKQAGEHRFGLVVHSMSDRDKARPHLSRETMERDVPGLPSPFLQLGPRPEFEGLRNKRQVKRPRLLGNQRDFGRTFSPKAVVDACHTRRETFPSSQPREQVHQRNAVAASGASDENVISPEEQRPATEGLSNLGKHSKSLPKLHKKRDPEGSLGVRESAAQNEPESRLRRTSVRC